MPQKTLDDFEFSDKAYKDPIVLDRLYNEEGLRTPAIADKLGVSATTIRKYMDRGGIERQTQGEAAKEIHRVPYAGYHMTSAGYHMWASSWDGEQDFVYVHRLLAVAEHGFDAVVDSDVHHQNGVPWLNYHDNIELLSSSDHTSQHQTGEDHHGAKLSREDVVTIKKKLEQGDHTLAELGDEFGVGVTTISAIKRGENWSHVDVPE